MIEGFKVSAIIVLSLVFMTAINLLLGLLVSWTSTTFIGEFFSLVSMYLPFNASAVFSSILVVCTGILSFLVAKKIFDLGSWSVNSA